VSDGKLTKDGFVTTWWATLNDLRIDVTTTLTINGEFEKRTHQVIALAEAINNVEIVEGSYTLGLAEDEQFDHEQQEDCSSLTARGSRRRVVTWLIEGFATLEVDQSFEPTHTTTNLIYPKIAVNTLRAPITAPHMRFTSIHYASPSPLPLNELQRFVDAMK
jgi:hypothetical protein